MSESDKEPVEMGKTEMPRPAGGLQMKRLPCNDRINWMDPMRGGSRAVGLCGPHLLRTGCAGDRP
jgi:hypothetical protein